MKTKIAFTVILFSLTSILVFSQEKSKKELREEKKIEKQNQIEALVNDREFVFIGSIAYPRGLSPVNLASRQNFVKFQPDMIESEMPFFGRAYSGVGFGGDAGLQFKGIPEDFTVVKGKKNFEIKAVVKGQNDTYRISLSVGFEGGSTLSIDSVNRSSISYQGEISKSE